ncbi:hypothetical protein BJX61DRAFT_541657 [Aspergillus egyptiacus]|nr:hypothetical protein BJX61DRAFT_541657 [Aspergillus egyptiacus]
MKGGATDISEEGFENADIDDVSRFLFLSQRPEWQMFNVVYGHTPYNIFERLSSYDPYRTCRQYLARKCPDTTSWIFSNVTFKDWLSHGEYPCLWLTGKIGCGKTFVTSSVVQFLENPGQGQKAFIAHFFYDHAETTRLKALDIFESYTKQILGHLASSNQRCPARAVANLKRLYGPEDVIFPLCQMVPDAIFVVNGLDECERPQAVEALNVFRKMVCENKSRIFISGREGLDVSQAVSESRKIVIADHGNGSDILKFIDWKIDEKTRDRALTGNSALLQEIRHRLAERADRMFLWVSLQLDTLWDECYTDADIEQSLENFPKDLSETYGRCIARINQRRTDLAYKILYWICVATRPFEVRQMQEALAIDPVTGLIDGQKTMSPKEILRICSHLVISDSDDCLRLTYYSVKQFLAEASTHFNSSVAGRTLSTAKAELGELCITHLLSPTYGRTMERYKRTGHVTDGGGVLRTIQKHIPYSDLLGLKAPRRLQISWPSHFQNTSSLPKPPAFFRFAKENWAALSDGVDRNSTCWTKLKMIALENVSSWRAAPWESIGDSIESQFVAMLGWAIANKHLPLFSLLQEPDSPSLRREVFNIPLYHYNNIPLLHLAAQMDFVPAVQKLIELSKGRLMDHKERRAIHHAAEAGSIDSLMALLSHERKSQNAQDKDGFTPVHLAVLNMRNAALNVLVLSPGINVDIPDSQGRTPLFYAVEKSDITMARTLLNKGANFNSKDAMNRTPVFYAATRLNTQAVELLVGMGAGVDFTDRFGDRALYLAVSAYMQLGPSMNAARKVIDALTKATWERDDRIIGCLIKLGALPSGYDRGNNDLLNAAVMTGNRHVVEPLLKNQRAIYHNTWRSVIKPLVLGAAQLGHSDILGLLLGGTASPDEPDGDASQAAAIACVKNHPEVIKLLVTRYTFDSGAIKTVLLSAELDRKILGEVESQYEPPQLLLAIAVGCGAVEVAETLLGTIATPDSRSFMVAVSMGQVAAANLLILRGAPIGLRALYCAWETGYTDIANNLLEHGAALEQIEGDSCPQKVERHHRGRKYDLSKNVADLIE